MENRNITTQVGSKNPAPSKKQMEYRVKVGNKDPFEYEAFDPASAFYLGVIQALRAKKDETTNVLFLKLQLGEWVLINERF
jgi:hypothetical protein